MISSTSPAIFEATLTKPHVFGDEEGVFFESFEQDECDIAIGGYVALVHDNHLFTLRQKRSAWSAVQTQRRQTKLAHGVQGEVFDVAVDLGKSGLIT